MARPIPPTPDIETEEELEKFKKAREVYANTRIRN